MSHTYDVPLTLNGKIIGRAALHEDNDGHLAMAKLAVETPEAGDKLLKLIREDVVTGFSVDAPPAIPVARPVGGEETIQ